MASPKYETFTIYDATTGIPAPGVPGSFTFEFYKDSSGVTVTPPTIVELGGGQYGFIPVFTDPTKGIVYTLTSPANVVPAYFSRYMRPEDWAADNISAVQTAVASMQTDVTQLRRLQEGRWKIYTSGADANRLVLYSNDGTTVLQKWNLKDQSGDPVVSNVFERVPVNSIP